MPTASICLAAASSTQRKRTASNDETAGGNSGRFFSVIPDARSPGEAKRNPGTIIRRPPDFASLHPGYALTSASPQFNFRTANAPQALLFERRGSHRCPFRIPDSSGSGAPDGATVVSRACIAWRQCTAPSGAPRGFSVRGAVASGHRLRSGPRKSHDLRRAFARLHRHRVQPIEGQRPVVASANKFTQFAKEQTALRLPATSRVRGCEPRPQAPHPIPSPRRL